MVTTKTDFLKNKLITILVVGYISAKSEMVTRKYNSQYFIHNNSGWKQEINQ